MSDTPRVDSVARYMRDPHWPDSQMGGLDMVAADFARQLERELIQCQQNERSLRAALQPFGTFALYHGCYNLVGRNGAHITADQWKAAYDLGALS